MVRSSKAAAASAVSSGTIASQGSLGSSTGMRFTPIARSFSSAAYKPGTRYHDMDFVMPRGTTIVRHWDNTARKFYVPAGKHTERETPFLPAGRFYRVTETSHNGNWPQHDPQPRARTALPGDRSAQRRLPGGPRRRQDHRPGLG